MSYRGSNHHILDVRRTAHEIKVNQIEETITQRCASTAHASKVSHVIAANKDWTLRVEFKKIALTIDFVTMRSTVQLVKHCTFDVPLQRGRRYRAIERSRAIAGSRALVGSRAIEKRRATPTGLWSIFPYLDVTNNPNLHVPQLLPSRELCSFTRL